MGVPHVSGYFDRGHWEAVHAAAGPSGGAAAAAVVGSAAGVLAGALPPGAVVADVACGDGPLLRALPAPLARVGLDLSAHALRRAGERGPGPWARADASALPLRSGSVDAVALLSAWWVLPDVARAVAEAARALRPGGLLLVHIWGRPAACRLITLGASAAARALPELVRPPGVPGPFDATEARVAATLARAGLAPPAWHRFECTWPIGTVAGYWDEFAALAPTAHSAYASAPARTRAAVDRLLAALLAQSSAQSSAQSPSQSSVQSSDGSPGGGVLGLAWRLAAAVKPG